ncbi:MAG: hypothetical protein WD696_04070 [Bryobacteraceae bacterium]
MDEWLRPYDVPPAEQALVEALDRFLVDRLETFIRARLSLEAPVWVGSKGSTARGTQIPPSIDFDLAVVGIDPERHQAPLNAALSDLRAALGL